MIYWAAAVILAVVGGVCLRVWLRHRRRRLIASRRLVEKPNSYYSSELVKKQEDRDRWKALDLDDMHPVNREEVERLLEIVDERGVDALSSSDRLFLGNMTRLSFGQSGVPSLPTPQSARASSASPAPSTHRTST